MKRVLTYSLKVWLTTGAISFVLSQIPLYYFYHNKSGVMGDSYMGLNFEIGIECLKTMLFLIVPVFLALVFVKRLYKHDWSPRFLKWVILFVSEFLTIFFLLDIMCMFNSYLLMPTIIMLAIFAISNAISIFIYSVNDIHQDLNAKYMELE